MQQMPKTNQAGTVLQLDILTIHFLATTNIKKIVTTDI